MADVCWSCRGTGTGTWCRLCKPAPTIDPVFGVPQEPGRIGAWMQTYMGLKCWPRCPRIEDLHIADIAIGLARECRYGKMTLRWYSVAEHSVIVSLLAGQVAEASYPDRIVIDGKGKEISFALAVEREGLFHDCDEAPLHDMPRPLKHDPEMGLERYRDAGKLYQQRVYERFGVTPTKETHDLIDTIDKRLVVDEVEQFMRNPTMYLERFSDVKRIGCKIPGLGPDAALELFLSRFADLFPHELRE